MTLRIREKKRGNEDNDVLDAVEAVRAVEQQLQQEYNQLLDMKYDQKPHPGESYAILPSPDSTSNEDSQTDTSDSNLSSAGAVFKREQLTLFNDENDDLDWDKLQSEMESNSEVDENYCFIQTSSPLTFDQEYRLAELVANITKLTSIMQSREGPQISADGKKMTFYVEPGFGVNATSIAKQIMNARSKIESQIGVHVEATGVGDEENERVMYSRSVLDERNELAFMCVALLGCVVGLLCGVVAVLIVKNNRKKRMKMVNLSKSLSADKCGDCSATDYQELCREHKAVKNQKPGATPGGGRSDAPGGSVSSDAQSERGSTSSWNEELPTCNMDISTGHIVLAYMETHLHDKTQLDAEWDALCSYEPDDVSFARATCKANVDKNRFPTALPFDSNCVSLDSQTAQGYGDYINASAIRDTHPEKAVYIMAQAPLESTVADFWQMVWEQRCTVAILFAGQFDPVTGMADNVIPRFWPSEGNAVYHNFEVHLVSEHVWCEDYLIRSVYLKNLLTSQTRTVTLFHYLTFPTQGVPDSPRALLEFRRKVNKAYKGKMSPVIVMCSSGCDQSGCYVLVDLILNKIYKGAKEIDMSATLEHIRDQRIAAVATKEQFEFCLATVAEEVNSILKSIETN